MSGANLLAAVAASSAALGLAFLLAALRVSDAARSRYHAQWRRLRAWEARLLVAALCALGCASWAAGALVAALLVAGAP